MTTTRHLSNTHQVERLADVSADERGAAVDARGGGGAAVAAARGGFAAARRLVDAYDRAEALSAGPRRVRRAARDTGGEVEFALGEVRRCGFEDHVCLCVLWFRCRASGSWL